jgi:hypothetical protein
MGRIDQEYNNMFEESNEVNRPDIVSDEDFVAATLATHKPDEKVLIHIEL